MARPQRNDVDYFPHYCSHGKGMFYIRQKYGNDGYAVWFMLLEHLGKSDYHYLDFSKEVQVIFLSSELLVSKERLLEIVSDLVLIEAFDKEIWEKFQVIYSPKFIESIKDAYRKRGNEILNRAEFIEFITPKTSFKADNSAVNPLSSAVNPQRREEDRIEEKSKEKKSKVNLDIFLQKFPYLSDQTFREKFESHLKVKKASKTEDAINQRLETLHEFSLNEAIEALKASIGSNWAGVFPKKSNQIQIEQKSTSPYRLVSRG
jgi:hypothetical protein